MLTPQSCDTLVALGSTTLNGQTLFAKNSDRPATECQPLVQQERRQYPSDEILHCQFVNLPQVNTTYRHIGSRPYWCWGYEHGFNEHQVVIGNEALPSRLPEATAPKLIGMEILRLGLERSRSAAEGVEVITALVSRYGQGKFANTAGVRTYDNGYIVADPREAYVIETAGHEWAVQRVTTTLGISNVYSVETDWAQLSPAAERIATEQGGWQPNGERFNFADAYTATRRDEGSGALRRGRSCAVLRQHGGGISPRILMRILSDHSDGIAPSEPFQNTIRVPSGRGFGICMHPNIAGEGGCSAASLVADLCADNSRLPIYWCSLYSPCLSLFLPIFSEGELPTVLTRGGAMPSADSPWWQFYALNQSVLQDPEARAVIVRKRWQGFQDELLTSAYEVATQARQWIDAGQRPTALRQLNQYMANNADRMLEMVAALLHEWTPEKVLA